MKKKKEHETVEQNEQQNDATGAQTNKYARIVDANNKQGGAKIRATSPRSLDHNARKTYIGHHRKLGHYLGFLPMRILVL